MPEHYALSAIAARQYGGDVAKEEGNVQAARRESLWRWLAISVGGATSPFVILALVWFLMVSGHLSLPLHQALRRGELFIPASVMNVETALNLRLLRKRKPNGWQLAVLTLCILAAVGGAISYGVTAALTEAPSSSVTVAAPTLQRLSSIVTSLSLWEFVEAFTIGTLAVMLLVRNKEGGSA